MFDYYCKLGVGEVVREVKILLVLVLGQAVKITSKNYLDFSGGKNIY